MPAAGDLGFQSLVLLACLVLPVIGLVVRNKWRLGMTRREEIKRLLVLASEESARVAVEASFGYTGVRTPRNYHCPVCYSPPTSRCGRCKIVRYCSGKCQIIHWRQGHKEECRSPRAADWELEDSDYDHKLASQDHCGSYDKKFGDEVRQHTESDKSLYGGIATPISGCSSDSSTWKDTRVELHAGGEENSSNSALPVTSFSEFQSSILSSEFNDDVSTCDSSSQSGSPRSDGYMSAQSSFNKVETASWISISEPSKQVSSVDKLKTENHPKFYGINPDCGTSSGASIDSSTGKNFVGSTKIYSANPDHQERIGSSIGSKGGVEDSVSSSIDAAENKSFLESQSSLHFSFSLSGGIAHSNPRVAEVNKIAANGYLPKALGINKTIGSTSIADTNAESFKVRNSPSSCEESQNMDDPGKKLPDIQVVKSKSSTSHITPSLISRPESGSIHDSCTSRSTSLKFERPFHVSINPGVSVPPPPSRRLGNIQVNVGVSSPDAHLSYNSVYGFRPYVQNELRRSKSEHNYVIDGSEIAGRYSDKGSFPYKLFVNLYDWKKVELQPSGLLNCGNSCYANVVLQCLVFTPPLTAYFLQGLHSKACAKEGWCFSCEFESLVLNAKEGKSPLSPLGIISQLRKIGSQLVNGKEEDAHEFLRCAIDTMQSIFLTESQVRQSGAAEEETTLIDLTFRGYLLSKIKCTRCESKSERIERFLDLTVEITGDIETMEEALQQYTSTEILDGENRYQCSRCQSYVKAQKKLTILDAPNILTIALKRFQSGKFGKLNKPVVFSEILDLVPFMSGRSDKSPVYRLYGVVVHLDVMNAAFSGHYVCYIRNNQNKWFKIDDSTVTAVDLGSVLTRGAYMLFYARCSPRAPRLIRSKIATNPKDGHLNSSWKSNSNFTSPDSQITLVHNSSNDSANISSFYKKFHQLRKFLEDDSTSDHSSLLSSNSNESLCSANSTSDSTSTDDLPNYIYGDSGCSWNTLQIPSDIDSSSSSSSSSSPLLYIADSSRQCAAITGARTNGPHSILPSQP